MIFAEPTQGWDQKTRSCSSFFFFLHKKEVVLPENRSHHRVGLGIERECEHMRIQVSLYHKGEDLTFVCDP